MEDEGELLLWRIIPLSGLHVVSHNLNERLRHPVSNEIGGVHHQR